MLYKSAHGVLGKVQSAFHVQELRIVKLVFKSSGLTHFFSSGPWQIELLNSV